MAKRELVDRKQAVEVVSNGFDRWHMINLLASQGSIPTITEQEIVKPYLDKICEEVLEYIDDLDIAYKICGIFDKYESERK